MNERVYDELDIHNLLLPFFQISLQYVCNVKFTKMQLYTSSFCFMISRTSGYQPAGKISRENNHAEIRCNYK